MPEAPTVQHDGETAVVHVRGDLVIRNASELHATLQGLRSRPGVDKVVLDCADLQRLDSAGVAVIQLARRELERAGKELELDHLGELQRAAFALAPAAAAATPPSGAPSWFETAGDRILQALASLRAAARLAGEVLRESLAVVLRRRKLPAGSLTDHAVLMGVNGVFVVGLLSLLLGVTIAFQGVVQLSEFGAGVFVADMVGWAMIREFAPFVTAIVLSGRTGAAIAAELGAMRVGQETDALVAMGVSPARFLVVPRLAALTFALPALTMIAMFLGIVGGMLVATGMLEMSPYTFWLRIAAFVELGDFLLGFVKSFVFAWIIGLTSAHLGMRTSGDAASVGRATTRTVVVSIFLIIVVDAAFATAVSIWEQ